MIPRLPSCTTISPLTMLEFCDVVLAAGKCDLEDCLDNHDSFLLCIPCFNIAASLDAARAHRTSAEHRRIVARLATHCTLCSEDLKGKWASHCRSRRHIRAAKGSSGWSDPLFPVYKETAGAVAGHVQCATCRIDIPDKEWKKHSSSSDHANKGAMATILDKFTTPVSTWNQHVSQNKERSRRTEQGTQEVAEGRSLLIISTRSRTAP